MAVGANVGFLGAKDDMAAKGFLVLHGRKRAVWERVFPRGLRGLERNASTIYRVFGYVFRRRAWNDNLFYIGGLFYVTRVGLLSTRERTVYSKSSNFRTLEFYNAKVKVVSAAIVSRTLEEFNESTRGTVTIQGLGVDG